MLLEVKVFGSAEWYDQGVPALEAAGCQIREDLSAADPESDGELIYVYFDVARAVVANTLIDVLKKVQAVVLAGEAPSIEMAFVPDRKSPG